MLNKFKSMGVAVVAGTAGSPDAISALVKQRKEVGLNALLIADGVGYVSDFYKLTGSASDGVIDMQPVLTTPEQVAFSDEFKAKYGYAPGAAAGGLAYDYTNFYLKVLQATLDRDGKLDSESIYKTVQDELWTGNLTYEDGVVMPSYRYAADTIPDPVVGTDAFYFPIIQYDKGKAVVIYPSDVAKGKLVVAP
jgi:branched-chain amino acid transport system substrate-binding protein